MTWTGLILESLSKYRHRYSIREIKGSKKESHGIKKVLGTQGWLRKR